MIQKQFTFGFLFVLIFMGSGCIGTDIEEEFISEPVLRITSMVQAIKVDEPYTFNAAYFDETGVQQSFVPEWSSSDPSIISINAVSGEALGLQEGMAVVRVRYQDLKDSLMVEVGDEVVNRMDERIAPLQGLNNYNVSGTATLLSAGSGLVLQLSSDFSATNGPGLYVYLSNFPNSVNGGVELGALQSNVGAQEYAVPAQVTLTAYNYVLIYCKPFGVPFGNGAFEN